ncbi:MAG TPA: 4a-hydroxytetrahydrobiopterin dehydratase [Acidobacteriaceae bacterium]|jgi:4a-hydroxytetrahydrobiopterin dehydratase|nr:4a-hydroxytetrahydrobiopterin dehydratase [Acidobacteriaceae bacterium]
MPSSKPKLSEQQLRDLLIELPEWALEDGKLVRNWTLPTFVEAMSFVNRVAQLAEEAQHHPDIDIRYNLVKLALVSHDAGGITERDAGMARQLSARLPTAAA